MYPLILVSKNEQLVQDFLADFKKEFAFSPSYTFEIAPLKTELTIDQVRQVKKDIITSTKEKRLIIFYHFDKANLEAQNALLKTLEEQTSDNQFVLVVTNADQVLPTIRSRSQIKHIDNPGETLLIRESVQQFLESISKTDGFSFLGNVAIQSISREDAILFFQEAMLYLRQNFSTHLNYTLCMKKAFHLNNLLQNNNLNPQLVVDSFVIFLKKNLK